MLDEARADNRENDLEQLKPSCTYLIHPLFIHPNPSRSDHSTTTFYSYLAVACASSATYLSL